MMLVKWMPFVSYTIRYLNQQRQQIKRAAVVRVEHFKDYLAIMTSDLYREELAHQLLSQLNGSKEVDHARRNNLLDNKEHTYVDRFGNLCLCITEGKEADVWFCDGLITADFTGVELIYFFEYNYEDDEQDNNGGI